MILKQNDWWNLHSIQLRSLPIVKIFLRFKRIIILFLCIFLSFINFQGHSRTRSLCCPDLLEQLPALQQLLFRLIGCQVKSNSSCFPLYAIRKYDSYFYYGYNFIFHHWFYWTYYINFICCSLKEQHLGTFLFNTHLLWCGLFFSFAFIFLEIFFDYSFSVFLAIYFMPVCGYLISRVNMTVLPYICLSLYEHYF